MNTDTEIIDRVLKGDRGAFRELVLGHQRPLYVFIRNMVRSPHDAEDLVQEVFVAAYASLSKFDSGRARFGTWLMMMARGRVLNHLKRRRVETSSDLAFVASALPQGDSVVQAEIWQQFSEALKTLPVEQQTAFVLAEIQELPHAEIAVIEGVELGTVKSRVSRARDRLRKVLNGWAPATAETVRVVKPPD